MCVGDANPRQLFVHYCCAMTVWDTPRSSIQKENHQPNVKTTTVFSSFKSNKNYAGLNERRKPPNCKYQRLSCPHDCSLGEPSALSHCVKFWNKVDEGPRCSMSAAALHEALRRAEQALQGNADVPVRSDRGLTTTAARHRAAAPHCSAG